MYREYMKQRKHKAALAVHLRMMDLLNRQLRKENRQDRRQA